MNCRKGRFSFSLSEKESDDRGKRSDYSREKQRAFRLEQLQNSSAGLRRSMTFSLAFFFLFLICLDQMCEMWNLQCQIILSGYPWQLKISGLIRVMGEMVICVLKFETLYHFSLSLGQ